MPSGELKSGAKLPSDFIPIIKLFKVRGEQKKTSRRSQRAAFMGFKLLGLRNTDGEYGQSNWQAQF